jgi:hypothetical protein
VEIATTTSTKPITQVRLRSGEPASPFIHAPSRPAAR